MSTWWQSLHILRVMARHRLDRLIAPDLIPKRAPRFLLKCWRAVTPEPKAPRGERVRAAFLDLGPVYIKLGQLLSTRRDLIPADIADALATLQDKVPPIVDFDVNRFVTDTLGQVYSFSYDNVGRLLEETDPLGRVITYTYDAANRLLSTHEPLGRVTSYTYDPVGNRLSLTDPRGGVTIFTYDVKDRLATAVSPVGQVTSYTYDAVNNQLSVTDPLSHTTSFTYDALNRRVTSTDPLGQVTTYAYDEHGNMAETTITLPATR